MADSPERVITACTESSKGGQIRKLNFYYINDSATISIGNKNVGDKNVCCSFSNLYDPITTHFIYIGKHIVCSENNYPKGGCPQVVFAFALYGIPLIGAHKRGYTWEK